MKENLVQPSLFDFKNDMSIYEMANIICEKISKMDFSKKVDAINSIREKIHNVSPFSSEPVDFIKWVCIDNVKANDYNPNSVAPPEMELLRHSINHDGYTQPVVTWVDDSNQREVVDGFHRTRVCRECEDVKQRVHSYLPVVTINDSCKERNDRIASTIRHNRARGKHKVESMSDIVIELKKRNWSDQRIGKELGMDSDEVLRLCQITGLAEVFSNHEFSQSWDIGEESQFEGLEDDEIESIGRKEEGRIYHTFDKWECVKYNFYGTNASEMTKDEAEKKYFELLSNEELFDSVLSNVVSEWKNSCEHYLTNEKMNRIAWLGQAALSYKYKIPACFRGGYNLLSDKQKEIADDIALKWLNIWLKKNGRIEVSKNDALSKIDGELY